MLLTRDANDFPWPVFVEEQTLGLRYKAKSEHQLYNVTFKRPNLQAIQHYISQHEAEMKSARKYTKKP